jgi:hypothetical protein
MEAAESMNATADNEKMVEAERLLRDLLDTFEGCDCICEPEHKDPETERIYPAFTCLPCRIKNFLK